MPQRTDRPDRDRVGLLFSQITRAGESSTSFECRPVVIVEGDKIRNPLYSATDRGVRDLDDLIIRALGSTDVAASGGFVFPDLYGWDVEYRQPYAVDLERATGMVKVLTKLSKAMARDRDTLGAPVDWADYAGRVARALGATFIIQEAERNVSGQWGYDAHSYRFHTIGRGVEVIRHAVAAWTRARAEAAGVTA